MQLGIRELFVLLLLLGFLGGSYQLGFRRIEAQRAHLRADVQQKRDALASLAHSSAALGELEAQLGSLKETIAVFERKLPKQKEVDQILADVWKLGERNALRAQSVRPMRVDRAGVCSEQPIELAFEGPFPGFFEFVRSLESADRIVRITDLDLRRITGEANRPMQAKLTLNIYFEPDAGGTAAATPTASIR